MQGEEKETYAQGGNVYNEKLRAGSYPQKTFTPERGKNRKKSLPLVKEGPKGGNLQEEHRAREKKRQTGERKRVYF